MEHTIKIRANNEDSGERLAAIVSALVREGGAWVNVTETPDGCHYLIKIERE